MDADLLEEVCQKTILHWNYRNFKTFPQELHIDNNVSELYLKENEITTLPCWIDSLTQLTGLHLFQNKLKILPHEIGELFCLEVLDVSQNFLSILPESICRLSNLQELIVSRNRLVSLPKDVGRLISLRFLLIDGNCLSCLPASLSNLSHLQYLNASSNFLKWLPMVELANGCELDVSGNAALTYLPAEMLVLLPRIKLNGCCQDFDGIQKRGPHLLVPRPCNTSNEIREVFVPLPAPVVSCCRQQCSCPQAPPLQELCLRNLSKECKASKYLNIPEPGADCAQCGVPVFFTGVARIWLCGDVEPLLVMQLYCSVHCVRMCAPILTELDFHCYTFAGCTSNCNCCSQISFRQVLKLEL